MLNIHPPQGKSPRFRRQPAHSLEALESRIAPAAIMTFNVTNTKNHGPGSLADAISAANANVNDAGQSDTILFKAKLSGAIKVSGDNGFDITDSVVIKGPGAGKLTLSGSNDNRLFTIEASAGDVTISGLTLTKGSAVTGGAILIKDSTGTVKITATTLTKNKAVGAASTDPDVESTAAMGGAIDVEAGHLVIDSTTISKNVAQSPAGANAFGGGIFVGANAVVEISASMILNNSALAGDGIKGVKGDRGDDGEAVSAGEDGNPGGDGVEGGLGGDGGDAFGGGIYADGALTIMKQSKISGNTATGGTGGDGGDGGRGGNGSDGGAAIPGGDDGSPRGYAGIGGNGAAGGDGGKGGGGYGGGIAHTGVFILKESTVSTNTASGGDFGSAGEGGGVGKNGSGRKADSGDAGPSAGADGETGDAGSAAGGGIASLTHGATVAPTASILSSTITKNSVFGANGAKGGKGGTGVSGTQGDPGQNGYDGGQGEDGTAGSDGGFALGGGIYSTLPLTVQDSTISGNTLTGGKGGAGGDGGKGGHGGGGGSGYTADDGTHYAGGKGGRGGYGGNGGDGGHGGLTTGAGIDATALLTITGSKTMITGNMALVGKGGAGGKHGATGGNASNPISADDDSGGGATPPIDGVKTDGDSFGGGIAASGGLTLADAIISANFAHDGGGIDILAGVAVLTSGSITMNTALSHGGGLFVTDPADVTVIGTLIANNNQAAGETDISGTVKSSAST